MTAMHTSDNIDLQVAGWAGMASGAGLALEFALWLASGWNPGTFANPATAIDFMSSGGVALRWASLAGFANLALFVVFNIGLCAHLARRAPTAASASLWLGAVGVTLHLLVPLSHWYGVPILLDAAMRDRHVAEAAWTALYVVAHEAAGGGGKLFLGLSMLVAGWAITTHRALPAPLGWLALAAGASVTTTVLAPDTPVSALASSLFMPGLVLSIGFRAALGFVLVRHDKQAPAAHA